MSRRRLTAAGFLLALLKYGALSAGAIAMMLPFIWMVLSSLMAPHEIMARPLVWFPARPQFENYARLAEVVPLGRMYLNSLIVTIAITAGVLFTSSLAGYGFAKFRFPGRDTLFISVLATMMIPFFVVLIPVFYLVSRLGWVDSYLGLIVPNLVTAFGIFFMRQYILSLPDELLDAARIDGASEFGIYWRIVLPLCGPALGALAILAFVYHWNSFLWPLIVVRSPELWTIPLGLNSLLIYASSPEVVNLQMAGATLAIIPVLIVFVLLQRWFVQGISLTGLKG
uniref:Carbohydrate ABC transporter permease n=1 Tax=Thermorudis peleae TaxID=1382356 RepID=A0A831TA72_9BACT